MNESNLSDILYCKPMKSEDLKVIQEPLKKTYRTNPSAALITLKASSKTSEGITCKLETGKNMIEAGLHPATGGDGLSVCSGDMLLESLAACAGVTLKAVATAIDFELQEGIVQVEGDLDFRGTLAVDKNTPVGFKDIRLNFIIKTNESKERTDALVKLTERYCVVLQTLSKANHVSLKVS
jgi:uncharacterized OsmC-like protein